jgi:hypothetical protein
MRVLNRRRSLVLFAVFVLLSPWWVDRVADFQELTAAEARAAIIAYVEGQPEERHAYYRLEDLRAGEAIVIIDEREEGVETSWTWNCHLHEKRVILPGPFRPHGCTETDFGVIEHSRGRWQLKMTGKRWMCGR